MKSLHLLAMRLLCALFCAFFAVTISAQTYVSTLESGKVYRITCYQNVAKALTDNGGANLVPTTGWTDASYETLWTVTASSETNAFTVKNLLTGRYMQGAGDGAYSVLSDAAADCYIVTTGTDQCFNILQSADGAYSLNLVGGASGSEIKGWDKATGTDKVGSIWQFTEVTLSDENLAEAARLRASYESIIKELGKNNGHVRITNDQTNGYVVSEDESNKVVLQAPDANNLRQVWVVEQSGAYFTFRNLVTGRYIDRGTGTATSLPTNTDSRALRVEVADGATVESPLFNIFHQNATENGWYYDGSSSYLQLQKVGSEKGWGFTFSAATDVQPVTPTEGKYYRINNATRPGFIIVNASGELNKVTSSTDLSQYWQIASTDGTNYTFRNAYTGQYVQKVATDATYTMGAESANFTLEVKSGTPYYYILDEGDEGFHATIYSPYPVIRYSKTDAASAWWIEEVTLSDEQVLTMRLYPILSANNGLVRLTTERSNGYVISDGGKANDYKLTLAAPNADDLSQLWIMTASGSNYTLRNVATGRYIDRTTNTLTELGTVTTATAHTVSGALSSTES